MRRVAVDVNVRDGDLLPLSDVSSSDQSHSVILCCWTVVIASIGLTGVIQSCTPRVQSTTFLTVALDPSTICTCCAFLDCEAIGPLLIARAH